MKDELTQAELNEIFYGKPPLVAARFFDEQVLDPSASRAAGHRVLKTSLYVELTCKKEDAHIIRPADDADKQKFRREYEVYVNANARKSDEDNCALVTSIAR
jgi:hypothetical protein